MLGPSKALCDSQFQPSRWNKALAKAVFALQPGQWQGRPKIGGEKALFEGFSIPDYRAMAQHQSEVPKAGEQRARQMASCPGSEKKLEGFLQP